MYPALNPYAPGSGRKPPALVGREADIDAFDLIVARAIARRSERGIVLHGLRGVGKTVLLNRFRDQAERASWCVLALEGVGKESGVSTARERLSREVYRAGIKLRQTFPLTRKLESALATMSAFCRATGSARFELGTPPAAARATSGDIAVDLEELIEDVAPTLSENSVAMGLFVDELQDVDIALLTTLLTAQHMASQRGFPFYLIGAGLPDLPARLSSARSYAERLFDYRPVGRLGPAAARAALVEPATSFGASFAEDGLAAILESADGYPYFLQTYGRATWNAAVGKAITLDDAHAGIRDGDEELEVGFYPARWDRTTPAERRYLSAMSELGTEQCRTAEISSHLGVPLAKLSTVRQQLLDKGVLFAPERGVIACTVPGMLRYVARQIIE